MTLPWDTSTGIFLVAQNSRILIATTVEVAIPVPQITKTFFAIETSETPNARRGLGCFALYNKAL